MMDEAMCVILAEECPECGEVVDNWADECPACGYSMDSPDWRTVIDDRNEEEQ